MTRVWVLLVVAFWSWHCAALSQPALPYDPPDFVSQQEDSDCGLAVLAMLARTTWEVAEAGRIALDIDRSNGFYQQDLVRLASHLGVALEIRQTIAPSTEEGIVVVRGSRTHALYVYRNYVYDPLNTSPEPYVIAIAKWDKILYVLVKV